MIDRVPGAELGFQKFYSKNILRREEIFFNHSIFSFTDFDTRTIESYKKSIQNENKLLFFGGDHSTTSFILENLVEANDFELCLVFDAHNDYGDSTEGFYNTNVVDYIEKHFNNAALIGFRDNNQHILKSEKFKYFSDVDAMFNQSSIHNYLSSFKNNKIYVSIDVDCISPVEFPAVGFPIAGGTSLTNLIYWIQYIKKSFIDITWDIVEYNPLIDEEKSSLPLERIIKEIFR